MYIGIASEACALVFSVHGQRACPRVCLRLDCDLRHIIVNGKSATVHTIAKHTLLFQAAAAGCADL